MKTVFITGGTGYIGRRLVARLLQKGYRCVLLIRNGSEHKVPEGAEYVVGNPFSAESFADKIPSTAVFVQLLGVPHPSPRKKAGFYAVDLPSVQQSVKASQLAGVSHFIYVSVSQTPSGIMRDYQKVRAEGEREIRASGLAFTFIRPWYVVGPGHWWPLVLLPLYRILEIIPATRAKALDLGLVYLPQMLRALEWAVDSDAKENRILNVPDIRLL